MHKEITPNQIIKNCLSFKGCKLLITSQLNNIVNNVFFSEEEEAAAKQLQSQQVSSQNIQIPPQKPVIISPQKPQASGSTTNLQSTAHNSQLSPIQTKQHTFQSPNKGSTSLDNIDNGLKKSKKDVLEMINKKMQFTAEQSDGKIQTRLKFVLQIEDPQFNLYYKQQKNQMILTSREKCFIMIQSHLLPYDKQKIDIKNNYKLFFKTLDCFAVRKRSSKLTVRWVDQYDDPTNQIFHIIRATNTVINFTSFNMTQCLLDFSKPYSIHGRKQANLEKEHPRAVEQTFKWNGQQRSRGLDLRVENLFSELESKDYQCFYKTLEFFSLLLQSEIRQKIWNRQLKLKKNELKNYGLQSVFNHLQKNLLLKKLDTKQQESHISYSLQACIIKILDSHRKPFLDFRLPSLKSATINFSNNSGSFYLIFGQVTLKNLMEDGEFIDMIQYSGNDLQIRIENDFVDLKGIDPNTEWRAYNRYECFIPPLTVRLTEHIYDPFYDFLFKDDASHKDKGSNPSSTRSSQTSSTSKGIVEEFSPYFYFGKVVIKDLRICLYYKSSSSLKRLNGVSAIIQPYIKENMFNTNQGLFDDFASYLKKQVASQIFSLLSQKVFGYSRNLQAYIYQYQLKYEFNFLQIKERIDCVRFLK